MLARNRVILFVVLVMCSICVYSVIDFRAFFDNSPIYIWETSVFDNKIVDFVDITEGDDIDSDTHTSTYGHDQDFILGSKFIINTTGCKIPRTPIIPEYFRKKWHLEQVPDCSYEKVNSILGDDQIIRLNAEFSNKNCCLHEITRVENVDKGYNLSPCHKFNDTNSADVTQNEILLTRCGISLNFDINLRLKPSVQKKLDFWENNIPEDLPTNIILFGMDTVSRSHAFRSLPQTMSLLKNMGFVDFHGYHSLAPATLENFMGFLMGLQTDEVRSGCAPSWTSPFDSCPFIWKEFSQRNYVTMYIEDGSQTFNWGGQSGFRQPPTDYYSHSLFAAIKELRKKFSPVGKNDDKLDCTSSETVPQFLVRYHKKFVRKFRDVPFFSFSWLEDPFHDNVWTLGTLDKEIKDFFQMLEANPDLLERTLIIFLSDHGDRYSFFQTKSMEGFIERGLPPFFIRIPQTLREQFRDYNMDLDNILESHTNALISPYDLHNTFKHILSLQDKNQNQTQISNSSDLFDPANLADRISLFVSADLSNRTCEILHVETGSCVCDTSLEKAPIENPFYLRKITEFAEERLNYLISSSKYAKVCAKWFVSVKNILYAQVLKRTDSYTEHLIQFTAMAMVMQIETEAKFEAKIKVLHSLTNFDGCEMLGDFERVSPYGNQSSCVNFENDVDKKMKELCMCKIKSRRKQ